MKFQIFLKENKWFITILVPILTALITAFVTLNSYSQKVENHNESSNPLQINWENITNNQITQTNIQNQVIAKSEYEVEKDKITDTARSFIMDFYQTLNNHNYERLEKLYHSTFIKDPEVQKYFSKQRWDRFMKCIDKSIQVTNIEHLEIWDVNNQQKNKRWFHYWIAYSIWKKEYKDDWEMVWVDFERFGNFRLAKLECKSPWCSNSPFFNPQKYCQ